MGSIDLFHNTDTNIYQGGTYFKGSRIVANQNIILHGMSTRMSYAVTPYTDSFMVWDVATQTIIAESSSDNYNPSGYTFNNSTWYNFYFLKPVQLIAGNSYIIGTYGGALYPSVYNSTQSSHDHVGSGLYSVSWNSTFVTTNGTAKTVYPTSSTTAHEPNFRLLFTPKDTGRKCSVNTNRSFGHADYSATRTIATEGSFNQNLEILGLESAFRNTGNYNFTAKIYDMSGNVLGQKTVSETIYAMNQTQEINFDSPVNITSGTNYKFAIYTNGASISHNISASPAGTVYNSSENGITFTRNRQGIWQTSSDNNPTSTNGSYEMELNIKFNRPNNLPTAPTSLSVAGPISIGGNPVASWSHNDPDSDQQAEYQIRWRKV